MRLIKLDDILKKFPKADFDGNDLENMKAYPHWETDITGLFNIIKSVPIIEAHEDCISREEAIKATYGFERYTGIDEAPYEYAESILRDLPPVTPKPKMGKWIDDVIENEDTNLPIQVCSICKTFYPLSYTGGGHNYCPNCGCRMEVEE